MKPTTKAISMLAIMGIILAVAAFYLRTHGIQEYGWLSVSMTSSADPVGSRLVGRAIPIDGKTSIRVTTISKNLKADGSEESYRIHADVYCICKQWISIDDRGWKKVYLASSQDVHDALRAEASLPENAVTHLNAELLLP
ncbi:MAG TPA: hypothetical protein VF258_11920 [Luteolibacter sp.]